MVKATKDNRPFSSGVFDLEEFNIYAKVIDLPLDGIPTYLEEGINGVCTGGSALFNVFSNVCSSEFVFINIAISV